MRRAVTAALLAVGIVLAMASCSPAQAAGWWQPTADKPVQWHWVLGGPLNLSSPVQMGLRDFAGNPLPAPSIMDIDGEMNSAATVAALHAQGKKVICYFDAGVYETYRTDAGRFPKSVIGRADEGWDGSYWLDIRKVSVLEPIMKARMQMCKDKGFDAIEPDEIDGWANSTGFPLTYNDQLAYNRALATWAHEINMSIGQKGDIAQSKDLVAYFDWTLNEECFQYDECVTAYRDDTGQQVPGLTAYTDAHKLVLVAEYKKGTATKWAKTCSTSKARNFNTSLFKLGLPNNGGRQPC